MNKRAHTEYPIHDLIASRWSPYGFSDQPVPRADLNALMEAARWAPSSYNEQPWRYILGTHDQRKNYARVLSCLVEANQAWAGNAPVLMLGIVAHNFERNGRHNRAAVHDLGLASCNLSLEATARGLFVHQMIGIDPDKAREVFAIPEGFEAWTALAVGYRAELQAMPDKLRERDEKPRSRKPFSEFVFAGRFGEPADLG